MFAPLTDFYKPKVSFLFDEDIDLQLTHCERWQIFSMNNIYVIRDRFVNKQFCA